MNPPVDIFARRAPRHASPDVAATTPAAEHGAAVPSPAGAAAPNTFAEDIAACDQRFKRPFVALAVTNGESPYAVTMTELRAQHARYLLAGDELRARFWQDAIKRRMDEAYRPDDDPPPIAA